MCKHLSNEIREGRLVFQPPFLCGKLLAGIQIETSKTRGRIGPMAELTRRNVLKSAALVGAGAAAAALPGRASAAAPEPKDDPDFKVTHNRIKQSVMGWCFRSKPNPIEAEDLAKECKKLGMAAMEGVSSKSYPAIRKMGLKISLVGSHGFKKGPCDPANKDMVIAKLKSGIDLAVASDCPSVITFTGMRVKGLTDAQMSKNCIETWKAVMPYAEEKKINLCFEHLNTRDDTHPMKGHPGYFGDDVDHCVEMIKAVGSPRMKLLFDIYHVQIMNGDVIRRIHQYKDVIGHYHTAGNPGRAELDDTQEINYPPILREIIKTGYQGYVAQEFIPTWDDKIKALRHAVKLCDV
jgi:hydroxypyruvate isomerase